MDFTVRIPDGSVQLLSEYQAPLNRETVFANANAHTNLDEWISDVYIKVRSTKCIKGSAYMEVAKTKVSANISPPTTIKKHYGILRQGQIRVTTRYTQYACKHSNKNVTRTECLISREVKSALQTIIFCTEYQNVVFDVNILVIEDDGCVLATAINCSIMALVQAKISAYELASASTIMLYKGQYYNNPNGDLEAAILNDETKQESPCYAIMTCTTLGTSQQICQLLVRGFTEVEQFNYMQNACLMMNQNFLPKMVYALETYLKEALKREPVITNHIATATAEEEKENVKNLLTENNDLNDDIMDNYEENDFIDDEEDMIDEQIIENSNKDIIEIYTSEESD